VSQKGTFFFFCDFEPIPRPLPLGLREWVQ
jgi:hypothetical protein